MLISRISSAVFNSVVAGLSGFTATINIPLEQLQDEVCETKLNIIYQYYLKNLLPKRDLYATLGCIDVDCKSLSKCCSALDIEKPIAHFEIPPIITSIGEEAIDFIGSIDKRIKFKVYLNNNFRFHKFKMRRKNKPYVYIDTSINENGMMDGYIFNAPLLEKITVIAMFADDRKLENFDCCTINSADVMTAIDSEVKDKMINKYLKYFRQYLQQPTQNDQTPK